MLQRATMRLSISTTFISEYLIYALKLRFKFSNFRTKRRRCPKPENIYEAAVIYFAFLRRTIVFKPLDLLIILLAQQGHAFFNRDMIFLNLLRKALFELFVALESP